MKLSEYGKGRICQLHFSLRKGTWKHRLAAGQREVQDASVS